ncbi:ABC-type nitrate/sulfonate/bicarbonate transport systems periplasmic components-like protein [Actinomycetales bacterium JB111]|nr:ABC-type nitrate/sulfonate/bicarbonate transport systems periplasmic components-like protein [Actinomycetales bacterium JB111]
MRDDIQLRPSLTSSKENTLRKIRILAAPAVLLTGALALAACGGGDADADADEGGGDGLTPITVGLIPIGDTAPAWLGEEVGIFEEHGLDVTFQVAQGGAAVIPAIISGEYQFGFSNTTSLLIAESQGLALTWMAPAASTTGDTSADFSAVLTMPGSGIEGPEDLAGHTVAVNTLNNIGDTTVRAAVDAAGGDADAVEFVELGFPDMPAALTSGQVDAAWVLDPFMTPLIEDDGAIPVTYPYAETDPELNVAAYVASDQYVADNPEIAQAFAEAMQESLAYAEEHEDEARAVLDSFTEIDPELQQTMVLPRWPDEFSIDSVQHLAELAAGQGVIDSVPDVASLIYTTE